MPDFQSGQNFLHLSIRCEYFCIIPRGTFFIPLSFYKMSINNIHKCCHYYVIRIELCLSRGNEKVPGK